MKIYRTRSRNGVYLEISMMDDLDALDILDDLDRGFELKKAPSS